MATVLQSFPSLNRLQKQHREVAWVRGHFQSTGENHGTLYESVKREQLRLGRILDPDGDP